MSIVHLDLPDARVLDLFAGSGALGLEAISRGARSADFIEAGPRSLDVLRRNIAALGAGERARVIRADALRFVRTLEPHSYDIAFADPPFASEGAAELARLWHERPFARILGLEHPAGVALPAGGEVRRYGTVAVTFYRS